MMPERLLQFIPFLATTCDGSGRPKLNTARLLEIAITLMAVWYGITVSVAKLEVKMDSIERHVSILDDRIYQHMVDFDAKGNKK